MKEHPDRCPNCDNPEVWYQRLDFSIRSKGEFGCDKCGWRFDIKYNEEYFVSKKLLDEKT